MSKLEKIFSHSSTYWGGFLFSFGSGFAQGLYATEGIELNPALDFGSKVVPLAIQTASGGYTGPVFGEDIDEEFSFEGAAFGLAQGVIAMGMGAYLGMMAKGLAYL